MWACRNPTPTSGRASKHPGYSAGRDGTDYFSVIVVQSWVFGHEVREASDFTRVISGSVGCRLYCRKYFVWFASVDPSVAVVLTTSAFCADTAYLMSCPGVRVTGPAAKGPKMSL